MKSRSTLLSDFGGEADFSSFFAIPDSEGLFLPLLCQATVLS